MENRITIVIPVFNREKIVERTLRSIERQTSGRLEVVLVDNGSTDGTMDVLRRWKESLDPRRFKVTVTSEIRPGAAAARNAGLRLVNTPYTMFFDSDDEMLPSHVADFEKAIEENPGVEIFGRSFVIKMLDGTSRVKRFAVRNVMYNHVFHTILSTLRYVVSTDLVRRVGGWNEDVMRWNDYELGVRLLVENPRMVELSGEPSVVVHETEASITGTRYWREDLSPEFALDCCHQTLVSAGEHRAAQWIDVRRVILAAKYRLEGHGEEATRLMNKTLNGSDARMRLRLLYLQHLLCRRGTAVPARIFF